MELKTKIYLVDENGDKFMGIGVLWLMKAIDESYSLRQAAAMMDISYSKAYTMISNLEKNLGHEIIERKKGGKSRAGASLTPFAKEFVVLYEDFQDKVKKDSTMCFQKFCIDYKEKLEEKYGN